MTNALVLDQVTVTRNGRTIVRDLALRIEPGTVVAITGPAGIGKTTLLEVVAGHRPASSGSIRWSGIAGAATVKVAYVAQNHALLPTLTAAENVMLSAMSATDSTDSTDHPESVEAAWLRGSSWLERLGLSPAAQANLAEELSGGQHQRVALARALAGGAALVAADDPTSELDSASVERAVAAIASVADAGAVVVVVTSEPLLLAAASTVIDLVLDDQ